MTPTVSQLFFDHEPRSRELQCITGPDRFGFGVRIEEDDEWLRVVPKPFPFVLLASIVFAGAALMGAMPMLFDLLDIDVPAVQAMVPKLALVTSAIVLVGVGVQIWRRRRRGARGPGAIVERRTGELALPWIEASVPRDRIVRFLHLRGRLRRSTGVLPFAQSAVLFRDAQERYVFAPITSVLVKGSGKHAAQRLADFYDLPCQQIDDAEMT